jgi:2-haloacid dehalogenase
MIDFDRFSHLTFDCYGTLIDWETGILAALAPVLDRHGVSVSDERQLEIYARHEAAREAGAWEPYRSVLRGVMAGIAAELGIVPNNRDLDALADSVGDWPPFGDSVRALERLKKRFSLCIVSNIDDALFALTARRLEVPFDEIVTAEQVGSYKPSPENFRFALKRLAVPKKRVLHVAQSLYHDHAPAKKLGFTTVWVNRPSRRPGTGVAVEARAKPDLEVPDMASLAKAAGV